MAAGSAELLSSKKLNKRRESLSPWRQKPPGRGRKHNAPHWRSGTTPGLRFPPLLGPASAFCAVATTSLGNALTELIKVARATRATIATT